MRPEYIIGIVLVFLLVLSGGILLVSPSDTSQPIDAGGTSFAQAYVEIEDPSGFVNTDGITMKELVGEKVILVDFLTYSCINCQRTFPYMNAWYEKYKDQGLEIIGIHTPEFAFEKDIDNVREAMEKFGITYPIVLDNDYATWRAYENRYWPRKYLIDIHGNIVYDHIGEGAYEETEKKIQELLAERAAVLGDAVDMDTNLAAGSIEEKQSRARSPETYFGASRNEYLANGIKGKVGEQTFTAPVVTLPSRLYLTGTWDIDLESAASVAEAGLVYRFDATEVYVVAEADEPIAVEVYQDGELLTGEGRGADVSEDGTVTVQKSGLYKLIKNSTPDEHVLELRVQGAGLRIFAFTFG